MAEPAKLSLIDDLKAAHTRWIESRPPSFAARAELDRLLRRNVPEIIEALEEREQLRGKVVILADALHALFKAVASDYSPHLSRGRRTSTEMRATMDALDEIWKEELDGQADNSHQ